VRSDGLPHRTDIVALAFHSEQQDPAQLDALPASFQLAFGQSVYLEHAMHRFQIELGGQVEHREIFIVESLHHGGPVIFPRGKMIECLAMGLEMAVDIDAHRHGALRQAAQRKIADYEIRTRSPDSPLSDLSGGNIQCTVLRASSAAQSMP
jgi:hypothetical protein